MWATRVVGWGEAFEGDQPEHHEQQDLVNGQAGWRLQVAGDDGSCAELQLENPQNHRDPKQKATMHNNVNVLKDRRVFIGMTQHDHQFCTLAQYLAPDDRLAFRTGEGVEGRLGLQTEAGVAYKLEGDHHLS